MTHFHTEDSQPFEYRQHIRDHGINLVDLPHLPGIHATTARDLVALHLREHPDHELMLPSLTIKRKETPPVEITELPAMLGVNPTPDAQLALGRIVTASGLQPAELVPELYDPANREVLDLLRASANPDTVSAAWDRLHPAAPVAKVTDPPPEPNFQAPGAGAPIVASFTIDGVVYNVTKA